MLCGLGLISAIVVSFLDIYGVKQLGDADNLRTESKKVVSCQTLFTFFKCQFAIIIFEGNGRRVVKVSASQSRACWFTFYMIHDSSHDTSSG